VNKIDVALPVILTMTVDIALTRLHLVTHSHRHSLNNPSGVAGSGVVTGHGGYTHAGRSAEADVTSSSEDKLGDRFSTACPLSVVLGSWPRRYAPAELDFPDTVAVRPLWLDSLLNCNVAPAVQRIGRSGRRLTVGPGHARTPFAAALHLVGDIGAVVVLGPGRSRNRRISSRVPPRATPTWPATWRPPRLAATGRGGA
jgi:hypothetical protein